jgi:hypothetical protein
LSIRASRATVSGLAGWPEAELATICMSPRRSESQSSSRSVTARATLPPLLWAKDVRLVDAEVVSNTASTIINGNDTNNIAATRRNPKRRLSDHQRKAVFAVMSVPVLYGGWGGFRVTPETRDDAKDFVVKQSQSFALHDR